MALITIRRLPPEEWSRLTDGPLAGGLPPSENVRIIAVEQAGKVVGYWGLVYTLHAEPVWLHPDVSHDPLVVKGLIGGVLQELQEMGEAYVFAIIADAQDEIVGALAERVGFIPLPGRVYGAKVPLVE